jgi:hypothetical protein
MDLQQKDQATNLRQVFEVIRVIVRIHHNKKKMVEKLVFSTFYHLLGN